MTTKLTWVKSKISWPIGQYVLCFGDFGELHTAEYKIQVGDLIRFVYD